MVPTIAPEQPDWLAALAAAQAARRLPPYGIVWEEPPPKQSGRHVLTGGSGYRIPSRGVPVMPSRHRAVVVAYLAKHPDRWARVYDGSPNTCDAMQHLLQRSAAAVRVRNVVDLLHAGAGKLQLTSRGLGLTTVLFARYVLGGRDG
jgi:hypothetical protein